MALILDGKKIRDEIADDLKQKISAAKARPTLVVIQVGENKESEAYINQKKLFAEKIGAELIHKQFPETISHDALLTEIQDLNKNKNVHGMLVQLPLPLHMIKQEVIDAIDARKDVDGLGYDSTVNIWRGNGEGYLPATARGVLTLLEYYKINPERKNITVIGKSLLVGKPIALTLLNKNATVDICHKQTINLREHTQHADIIIVAAGVPGLITPAHINTEKKQVVIDVGITSLESNNERKVVGDVDFNAIEPLVAAITPVPGGVGPLTVASLFQNLWDAWTVQQNS